MFNMIQDAQFVYMLNVLPYRGCVWKSIKRWLNVSTVHVIYVEPIALQGWWKVKFFKIIPTLTRYMFWHGLRHTIWKYLWQIYSRNSIWHFFWHCIWRIFCRSVCSGPGALHSLLSARYGCRAQASWSCGIALRSSRTPQHPQPARKKRRREGEEGEEGEEEGEEEEGVAPLLKSRNLHLAGGEKELKIEVSFFSPMYCFVGFGAAKNWHNAFKCVQYSR